MLETRDVPGATELEAPSRRPPIRGVNETPRSNRPKPAVRIVRKLSPVAGRAAFSGSVISTSLFGSAPWSPPPLTVEMMAQIVTVPLGLTRPVMLRSPSAAADHGWPVAAFSPVG
jgi:hypothetical protein